MPDLFYHTALADTNSASSAVNALSLSTIDNFYRDEIFTRLWDVVYQRGARKRFSFYGIRYIMISYGKMYLDKPFRHAIQLNSGCLLQKKYT